MLEYSDEQVENLLKDIFDGVVTPYDLPEDLYYATADYLKKALYKGFGGALKDFAPGSKDAELLTELRENVYMFSAAKTYEDVRNLTDALVDEDDNIRPFGEFRDVADGLLTKFNEDWLETEYETAIGQAQNAVRWQNIEQDKKTLPFLRYSTVGDENTCEVCGPLNGVTLAVDDPFWNSFMPDNHFRCRCTVEQLDESAAEEETPADEVGDLATRTRQEMRPEFLMNPGKDKVIFSKEHPYFDVAPKDRDFAAKNFGLPIPEDDE